MSNIYETLGDVEVGNCLYEIGFNNAVHSSTSELFENPGKRPLPNIVLSRSFSALGTYHRIPFRNQSSVSIVPKLCAAYSVELWKTNLPINQTQDYLEHVFLGVIHETYFHEMEHWSQDSRGELFNYKKALKDISGIFGKTLPSVAFSAAIINAISPIIPTNTLGEYATFFGIMLFNGAFGFTAALREDYINSVFEKGARAREDLTNPVGLFQLTKKLTRS